MLTDKLLRGIDRNRSPMMVGGAPGLRFYPTGKGRGKFKFRFTSPVLGKRRDMGLGCYPDVKLSEARDQVAEARKQLRQGIDPIQQRRLEREARRSAPSGVLTFEAAARQTFESKKKQWKSRKATDQWITSLERYIFPITANRPITELNTTDFSRALSPIWLEKPETAKRVKQRCSQVFEWLIADPLSGITTNPLLVVRSRLPQQPKLGERRVHHPAMPYTAIPEFLKRLRKTPTTTSKMLEFLILTAARSGEVRFMVWDEVDMGKRLWTVPGSRMKAGREHQVPLSARAVELLASLSRSPETPLVFPSPTGGAYSDMSLLKVLRDGHVASSTVGRLATPHGFRSSFRDFASEKGFSDSLAERALAHTVRNQVEAAYWRTNLYKERIPMMEAWGNYLSATEE